MSRLLLECFGSSKHHGFFNELPLVKWRVSEERTGWVHSPFRFTLTKKSVRFGPPSLEE
jgi:hypothetical protein